MEMSLLVVFYFLSIHDYTVNISSERAMQEREEGENLSLQKNNRFKIEEIDYFDDVFV
jgi:hypothetical protein